MDPLFLGRLDRYREALGRPVRLLSAYRSQADNRRVGGAVRSQHLLGRAADLERGSRRSLRYVRSLGLFSGLGVDRAGNVVHVDARRSATPERPVVWYY